MKANDGHLQQGLRRKLVEALGREVKDTAVLGAIGRVPRHLFIDDTAFLRQAYEDIAFPIGMGQTISQPRTVAIQSSLLQVVKGEKVLEIGTGSGYQTAVLCELGARVVTIERMKPLHVRTKARLAELGYKATLLYGDGFAGAPAYAPFDKVLVTCGAPDVPPALLDQLKPGGRLVIPVSAGQDQVMWTVDKQPDGSLLRREHGRFRFVPMLTQKVAG
ncbi:MAG: protein-L-isoaspartate(D-aspartate) O-methyltransferase [Flavobacteriales bacterium]|nr:protein-L-isoaspartate(D-aspartate) O-methyltransferase [Flavobacteriales bacterium]